VKIIDAAKIKEIIEYSTLYFKQKESLVNNLNVFPVPDGDTGSNMLLTMKSVRDDLIRLPSLSMSDVAKVVAQSSLMGARGNSGVLLSQFLSGFSKVAGNHTKLDSEVIARAMQEGVEEAYNGLSNPVEGTILTVMKEIARGAKEHASDTKELEKLFELLLATGRQALDKTPEQLPVLKDAGVVDAGGCGFLYLIEAVLRYLHGIGLYQPSPLDDAYGKSIERWRSNVQESVRFGIARAGRAFSGDSLKRAGKRLFRRLQLIETVARVWSRKSEYQYCLEFFITGEKINLEELRKAFAGLGGSTIVAGNPQLAKVHIHTNRRDEVLSEASRWGRPTQIKVDDMSAMQKEFISHAETPDAEASSAVVVACTGNGMTEIFKSLGASSVIEKRKTINPSVKEFLRTASDCQAEVVFVLPNNKNAVLAAEHAAMAMPGRLVVIPTRSMVDGISALLSYIPGQPWMDNKNSMLEALKRVHTCDVTRAARNTMFAGRKVRKGEVIGIANHQIVASGIDPNVVTQEVLKTLNGQASPQIVSIYYGRGISQEKAEELKDALKDLLPQADIQIYRGGQKHHYYLLGVE